MLLGCGLDHDQRMSYEHHTVTAPMGMDERVAPGDLADVVSSSWTVWPDPQVAIVL